MSLFKMAKLDKLFLVLILIHVFHIGIAQKSTLGMRTIIEGKIVNATNAVSMDDMSEWKELKLAGNDLSFIPDSTGYFKIEFLLDKPKYFRIRYNLLYLKPGDSVYAVLDMLKRKGAYFGGANAKENLFLQSTYGPKGGSYLNSGADLTPNRGENLQNVHKVAQQMDSLLDNSAITDSTFYKLEKARIRADVINSYALFYNYYSVEYNIRGDSLKALEKYYYDSLSPAIAAMAKDFFDTSFLALEVYRDITWVLPLKGNTNIMANHIADWALAKFINRKLLMNPLRDSLQRIKGELKAVRTSTYRHQLEENIRQLERFNEGDLAIDFECYDLDGNRLRLSNFKGKVIYIDFWATWCGPCIDLFPALIAQRKNMESNQDIIFLSVSIDDDMEKWKIKARKYDSEAQHLRVNRLNLSAYNIYGIPRAIIVDKQFRVVKMNAPDPASPELKNILRGFAQVN